mmetsp:Transcript_29869/g.102869  ORF Transcript_29869/g.102869 Transcript_29869/m.102869 type:complete len:311 (+) Transcript_29869:861-1793(+)
MEGAREAARLKGVSAADVQDYILQMARLRVRRAVVQRRRQRRGELIGGDADAGPAPHGLARLAQRGAVRREERRGGRDAARLAQQPRHRPRRARAQSVGRGSQLEDVFGRRRGARGEEARERRREVALIFGHESRSAAPNNGQRHKEVEQRVAPHEEQLPKGAQRVVAERPRPAREHPRRDKEFRREAQVAQAPGQRRFVVPEQVGEDCDAQLEGRRVRLVVDVKSSEVPRNKRRKRLVAPTQVLLGQRLFHQRRRFLVRRRAVVQRGAVRFDAVVPRGGAVRFTAVLRFAVRGAVRGVALERSLVVRLL